MQTRPQALEDLGVGEGTGDVAYSLSPPLLALPMRPFLTLGAEEEKAKLNMLFCDCQWQDCWSPWLTK